MPRFVILQHDHPELHWDLMLECGPILRTWRLSSPPKAECSIVAEPAFDHRLVYLVYEGPVSGGRGNVVRWDHGTFEFLEDSPNCVVVRVGGQRLAGWVRLIADASGRWQVRFDLDHGEPGLPAE